MSGLNDHLDPRDEANWAELAKRYQHLSDWSTDQPLKSERTKATFIKPETWKFLRTPDGLVRLHEAWRAAVWKFSKHEQASFIDAGGWERQMTIAGLTAEVEKSCVSNEISFNWSSMPSGLRMKKMFSPDELSESEQEQVEAYELDPENYNIVSHWIDFLEMKFHIAIQSTVLRDQFIELQKNISLTQVLADDVWESLRYAIPSLAPEDERIFEESDGQREVYMRGIEDAFDGIACRLIRIQNTREIREICGFDFNALLGKDGVLKSRKFVPVEREESAVSEIDSEGLVEVEKPWKFLGKDVSPVEKQLADQLRAVGYLVIYEPDCFIPEPGITDPYRKPDLIVVDNGRMLAIEIDDMSHVKDLETGKFNWRKYQRDEDLRTYLLTSGIPMIRVWHRQVRDTPQTVVNKVVNTFHKLWGFPKKF